MKTIIKKFYLAPAVFILINISCTKNMKKDKPVFIPAVSYARADSWADSVLSLMTLDEKITYIGGTRGFFTQKIERLGINSVFMTDATQGVHLRDSFRLIKLDKALEKSTSLPCPVLLASTWNRELAGKYAGVVGEQCRAGGIGVLLGPGMNIYRISQCGRNFEYFGEDPFLAAGMIENYVVGMQNTGTIATLKHFVCNNTDFYRRKSNSIVSERALHEIYLPAFKAGVDAGAMAVMTSYNQLNGEWCGQSEYTINNLLRKELGFKWMVMTDWWSVWDGVKVVKSGQDIEMPAAEALANIKNDLDSGKVTETQIDRMVKSTLRTLYAMKSFDRVRGVETIDMYKKHEEVALQTAREGIVLLKNDNNILPLGPAGADKILVTGKFLEEIPTGGGSAIVEGYNKITLLQALVNVYGNRLEYIKNPDEGQIKKASLVICSAGTLDSEGWDRSFNLPENDEAAVLKCVDNNDNTVVIVNTGSGINMTAWKEKAAAILYSWYPGQNGNIALAEILSGKVNPSGKLPITIEKQFEDSPGYGYIPEGEELYTGWNGAGEKAHGVYDIKYNEDIFVGYRWYENKQIEPLFAFGHGLSYTVFEYSNIAVSKTNFAETDVVEVKFDIRNTGKIAGAEIAQLYLTDIECSVPRPVKELKGFEKIMLQPGEIKTVSILLNKDDFSFWHPDKKQWIAEPGEFEINVGASSMEIKLKKKLVLM